MSTEIEPVFSSNGVRSAQKDAKDIEDLKGREAWERVGQWEQLLPIQRWEYA